MRLALFLLLPVLAAAAPCTTPDGTCTEKLPLSTGTSFLVYRSQPLTDPDASIERVFILVHGLGRDGDTYYKSAIAATQEAGELHRTLVIAPQFHATDATCQDHPDPGETIFACRGWSDGVATKAAPTSSFTAMDELVRALAGPNLFPSLKEIVVAGHSAGGQFVQRYAAVNRIDGTITTPIRYVVANPSSYLYLESWRPVANPADSCPQFNRYKYGLDALSSYPLETGAQAIRANSATPGHVFTRRVGHHRRTQYGQDVSCDGARSQSPRARRSLFRTSR